MYEIGQEIEFYVGDNIYSGKILSVQLGGILFVQTRIGSILQVTTKNVVNDQVELTDEDQARLDVFKTFIASIDLT